MSPDALTIDPHLVARKAIELADARPEFIYTIPTPRVDDVHYFHAEDGTVVDSFGDEAEGSTCLYVHHTDEGTEGGCIFGQALLALGLTVEQLAPFEERSIIEVFGSTAFNVAGGSVVKAMGDVQTRQDRGDEWVEAIEPLKAWFAKRELVVSAA